MATITIGAVYGLWIPPGCNYQLALNYCCSAAPTTPGYNANSYKREFNLSFAGSSRPSILICNVNRPGCWADAPMAGWGKGQVRICTAPNEKRWWLTKWPDPKVRQQVFCGLLFHELGHLILNTENQNIGCPLSAAMRARGVAHWGRAATARALAVSSDEVAVVEQAVKNAVDSELMNTIAQWA